MVMRWFVIVALIAIMAVGDASLVGGWGNEKLANPYIQDIANSVKAAALAKWDKLCKSNKFKDCSFNEFKAETYKSQLVAGMNYVIKVRVQPGQEIVIKVFVPLPYLESPAQLVGVVPYVKGEEIGFELFEENH